MPRPAPPLTGPPACAGALVEQKPPEFGKGPGSTCGGTGSTGMRQSCRGGSGSLHPSLANINQRRFPASPRSNYTQDEAGNDTLSLINNSAWLRAG